jgi:hypothetical protein
MFIAEGQGVCDGSNLGSLGSLSSLGSLDRSHHSLAERLQTTDVVQKVWSQTPLSQNGYGNNKVQWILHIKIISIFYQYK